MKLFWWYLVLLCLWPESPKFGITFYDLSWEGRTMACGGTYQEDLSPWAAVPIEWIESGLVQCGDLVTAMWADGRIHVAVVRDTGCHLHYDAWDSGRPYAVDFDAYGRNGLPTETGIVQFWRDGERLPVETFPLEATAVEYCNGPLTVDN